ncbi:hypothetical protein ISN44_As01g068980 [Arabidopsis suecica]|uniref:Uncharacterized protein n=1 Tax=Arabidopsis suecica TaxID=45249 RepID=A0A8T2HLG4_ARASU|nr:hypothetical protein ISN44_As01g068980 [Arabidopsis suecica]
MLLLKLSWEALFVEFTGVSMPLQYSRIALICQSFLVTFFAFAVLSYLPCFSLVHVLLDASLETFPILDQTLFHSCLLGLLSMNSSDVEGSICANQSTGPQLVQIPGLYLVLVINVTHIIPTEGSSLQ